MTERRLLTDMEARKVLGGVGRDKLRALVKAGLVEKVTVLGRHTIRYVVDEARILERARAQSA